MKKQLKVYFKEIKKNLPCYNKTMKKMLGDLKEAVDAFVQENSITDFTQIEQHFGTAQDIAKEFTVGVDSAYIKSYKFKKRVTAIVLSVLAAIMVAVSALVIYIIVDGERNQPITHDTNITYENKGDK